MPNKSPFSTLFTWVSMPSLILFLCAGSARAQISLADYTFVVASGFICDPGDSGGCPAVAKSANGDSYEISGAGTFDMTKKSVQAAGTFARKAASGTMVDTGVWIATELESFVSYGLVPSALRQNRLVPRPRPGLPRLPISDPMPTGGLAVFHIRLLSMSRAVETAVLQVNCALGDVPHEHSVEGIRLTFEKSGSEFSEEAGGRVMFLAVRSGVTRPRNTSLREGAAPEVQAGSSSLK